MNKTMTSLIALGVGAAAYTAGRNNNISTRSMKKLGKRMVRAFK